ncbi:MAG: hypothetical protein AMQ74_00586 [Candidatus Methanofastidiosum methylothiophilum]|uniref:Uncharacterized protein n=1 Tax=Candidatus Methanofastidiosum methylothiophilum TaxID=1705564 RepID=A0A150J7E4_9EURY|nr:MAG: hypothetical protein AMQ74_00586 [Candidatus Methanofastidiosum methylthiophilus]NMC76631.1 hypothetical protein [Candidatus Methanofastidiosa archaeon]
MNHSKAFIFISILLFSFNFLVADDVLYELTKDHTVIDASYDPNIESFYIVSTIRDTNNSSIIKTKNGQLLRQQTIENFKVAKMQIDKLSNVYLIGISTGGDITVVRLSSSLSIRWITKIRISEKDTLSSFFINDDQEVTVLGYSSNKRESDTFLVKIDSNGKITVKSVINVGPYEKPYALIEDKDNNIYITGEMKEKDVDVFLLKLSKDHELLWVDFFDNSGWEDGGLDIELIDNDIILTAYSGKEGWYVFDTVFLRYSPDGNVSNFVRKSYSNGSDWVRQLEKKDEYYYAILWDILTGKEYGMKLDYYFEIISKKEISKEENPVKIINVKNNTYLLTERENKLYLRNLD